MKKIIVLLVSLGASLLLLACANQNSSSAAQDFVQVSGVQFKKNGNPYFIAGTNMWYAAYLGSPGKVGDRDRLAQELDTLKSIGVNNLRVLAVSEKSEINSAVKPATTNGFGNYDESLLQGLDYLLVELAKRDMTVVLYFNNFWQWSGGMSQYVSWFTDTPVLTRMLRESGTSLCKIRPCFTACLKRKRCIGK